METNRRKRWMAGALAAVMCCTSLFSTGTMAATAETDGVYQEQVQTEIESEVFTEGQTEIQSETQTEQISENEAQLLAEVTDETQVETQPEVQTEAESERSIDELWKEMKADPELALTITAGESFEIKMDFTGLKLKDEETAELKKAAMEDGTDFDYNVPGTYKCLYQVSNAAGETYLIVRTITVTPREAETSSEQSGGSSDTSEDGEADGEADSQAPLSSEQEVQSETVVLEETGQSATTEDTNAEETVSEAETETEMESEIELVTETVTESQMTEQETELATETVAEEESEAESEGMTEAESESEAEAETEAESETESEVETEVESEAEGQKYQVFCNEAEEFTCLFDREELLYEAGEEVRFSIFLTEGFTVAGITASSRYEDGTSAELDIFYDAADTENFYFVMPETEVDLTIACADADQAVMLMAEEVTEEENEDPVPDKFKLINTGNMALVPDSYQANGSAATQIRKVVFTDDDGNKITKWAFCLQPNLDCPPGGTYDKDSEQVEILETGSKEKNLAKCLYYMYGGPAWGKTIDYSDGSGSVNMKSLLEKYGCSTNNHFFAVTHYVLGYIYVGANGNWNANSGVSNVMNSYGQENIALFVSKIKKLPMPKTELSTVAATATYDSAAGVSISETVKYSAIDENTATITFPDGVVFVNESTGERLTGKVTISGGTKFHLEAATSVSGIVSYTLKCKYAVDFTAMALKTPGKQDVGFSYYSGDKTMTLSVEWPEQAKVSIVKKDAASGKVLSGAVYGIYSDEACTNLIVEMPATDENGASSVELTKTAEVVYLKEISVPARYVLDTKTYNITLVTGGSTTQEVTNSEQMGALTIYKEGEMFTGADVTENGVTFHYETRRQKGAVYNIYAGADITAADGRVIYKKGALVKESLTTGDDGSSVLENLYLGSYVVTEMKAPENLVCTGEFKTVTLEYAGANVPVQMGSVTFTNARQKAAVTVEKQDNETKVPLSSGIYGLYAGSDLKTVDGAVAVKKDTLIETVTTTSDGKATYTADLPIGFSYYLKELQAPEFYLRNSDEVYAFEFLYTNDKEATVKFSHTFTNERVDATIHLIKKDQETGEIPQGDAIFTGAVYGLFARSDILHPDGQSGVIYKADEQVATLTINENGTADVTGLYLGSYYIRELTPSPGYLLDENEYDLTCNYEGDLVKTVERTAISFEQVIKQPFQLIKAADNDKTDADLLEGAGFSVYLESALKKKEDGSYDFTDAKPIVVTADGKTEMFTDETGYACSIGIPYGVYIVRETTTPHNFTPVDDFKVTISENKTEPQTWRVLLDEEFEAKLKIVKKDDETKQSVLLAGTEFRVFDLEAGEYVEQVTTYPQTKVHTSYFTDENGYLILPNALKCGRYRIEEVGSPYGYTLNTDYVEIQVDSNTAYEMESISKDAIITVAYENHPVKGKLVIKKYGEVVTSFGKDFKYEESLLSGAVYEVYAAEDIYTADHQVDAQGNRHLEYAKDTLVATVTTDENGEAVVENLPIGTYRILEKQAPVNHILNTVSQEVTFTYEGQTTPVVEREVTFKNERQKVELTVEKQDAQSGSKLKGAIFGLYNKEDIVSGEKVIVKSDTLLQKVTSDENGLAKFTLDLPLSQYYVLELASPAGYTSSDEVLTFDASYQGQDVPVVTLSAVKKNEPTVVEITKSDITTGTELSGATLTVLDKKGNVVDTWTSVKGEPHVIKRLVVGKTYTLREEFAPHGYLKASEITFTISDTAEVQKVEMKDEVPTALLIVNKKGEFLDNVSLLDNVKGTVEHLFGYITGTLTNVTFEVYAAEAIRAADGVSKNYYAANELVATITTDSNGIAQLENLPVGRYYIKEVGSAYGHVLDSEPRYVDLSYRDQNTSVVVYDENWQNNRQRVQVEVLKKERGTEHVLSGAVFGLFTKDNILSSKGKVLMEADTLIELKTTDEDGKIRFVADLPVGYAYYVKELHSVDGYVNSGEMQEFTFTYQGEETAQAEFSFVFENDPTTVAISKADLTTCEEIPGASLQVLDENGEIVDEWISETEPHLISKLTVGKTYKLVERIPANGYATAESIEFKIENTAEIQKHTMLDDTTKVEISKTDVTDCKEVPGAKLIILNEQGEVVESWISGTEPYFIEKLPIGRYILREEQAPLGYLIAEEVAFEVADTGEIQKVEMKDARPEGRLVIKKTDTDSKMPLAGVEFTLKELESGKTVATLVTDQNGIAKSEALPTAIYEDGRYKEDIEYVLTETKALEGYEVSKEEIRIVFEYLDDQTKEIEITKELTNTKTAVTTPEELPKTGDHTNIWLPVLLAILSLGSMAAVIWYWRKKNHS